jgi:glycosyltransferase involved in cell wall biosynthesis
MGFVRMIKRYPTELQYMVLVTGARPDAGGHYNPLHIYMDELKRVGLEPITYGTRLVVVDSTPPHIYLADEAINQIYNAADVGVNSANGEGFGLCQLEHLATGAPQVVLDIGGYRSFLNDEVSVLLKPSSYSYLAQNAGIGTIEHSVTADEFADGMDRALQMSKDASVIQRCLMIAQQRPWSRICDDFLESVISLKKD